MDKSGGTRTTPTRNSRHTLAIFHERFSFRTRSAHKQHRGSEPKKRGGRVHHIDVETSRARLLQTFGRKDIGFVGTCAREELKNQQQRAIFARCTTNEMRLLVGAGVLLPVFSALPSLPLAALLVPPEAVVLFVAVCSISQRLRFSSDDSVGRCNDKAHVDTSKTCTGCKRLQQRGEVGAAERMCNRTRAQSELAVSQSTQPECQKFNASF